MSTGRVRSAAKDQPSIRFPGTGKWLLMLTAIGVSGIPLTAPQLASGQCSYAWHPVGSGMYRGIHALTVHGGELIAAGISSPVGAPIEVQVARWDGTSWQPLGSGMNSLVFALTAYNGELIAAGQFTQADGFVRYVIKP